MGKKNSKGRVRVFFAEFEGDDDTIQEGMRALAVAVNKTFQPKVIVQRVPLALGNAVAGDDPLDADEIDELPEDSDDLEGEFKPAKPISKRTKPPKLELVKDLDLVPDGKRSLKDFYEEKAPTKQNETITVCLYWLRHILEIDNVTPNHIYTCLKRVGVKVPTHLPQTIRNIAARNGWIDTSESNSLQITTGGENLVDHDLSANGESK